MTSADLTFPAGLGSATTGPSAAPMMALVGRTVSVASRALLPVTEEGATGRLVVLGASGQRPSPRTLQPAAGRPSTLTRARPSQPCWPLAPFFREFPMRDLIQLALGLVTGMSDPAEVLAFLHLAMAEPPFTPNLSVRPEVGGSFGPADGTTSHVVLDSASDACAIIASVLDFGHAGGRSAHAPSICSKAAPERGLQPK